MIIETDLGHDPDDFLAISSLLSGTSKRLEMVLLTPGTKSQVAIAQFLRNEFRAGFQIGVHRFAGDGELTGIHKKLVGTANRAEPDGLSRELLNSRHTQEFLVLGPAKATGEYVLSGGSVCTLTMQGGFCPYSIHRPAKPVEKFIGKDAVPSFNPNGARKEFRALASCDATEKKRFVGKNVCHSFVFDGQLTGGFFRYVENGKKLHDVLATLLHLQPWFGDWVTGTPVLTSGCTTVLGPDASPNRICVDVNHEACWDTLRLWVP